MNVSVIIPTYNRAQVLPRAVASVLAQSHSDLEVIVVDDGSSDETPGVLAALEDPRVRCFRQTNQGVAAARNTGLQHARGDLISFLDSDDEWLPDKLEAEVAYLAKHPEVDAVFSDPQKTDQGELHTSFVRETEYFPKLIPPQPSGEWIQLDRQSMYRCLLKELPVRTSTVTMRSETQRTVGLFDPAVVCCDDWDYFLRISKSHRFAYLDGPLAIIHVLGDALHRRAYIEDKHAMLKVLWREWSLTVDPETKKAIRTGIASRWCHLGWEHLTRGRRLLAFAAFWRGFWGTREPRFLGRAVAIYVPGVKRLRRVVVTPGPNGL